MAKLIKFYSPFPIFPGVFQNSTFTLFPAERHNKREPSRAKQGPHCNSPAVLKFHCDNNSDQWPFWCWGPVMREQEGTAESAHMYNRQTLVRYLHVHVRVYR